MAARLSHSVVAIGLDGSLNKVTAQQLAEALAKVVAELKEPTPALATLSKLADMVTNLRTVQKRYFENRQSADLATSKKMERELDAFLKDYEKGIAVASQANLF